MLKPWVGANAHADAVYLSRDPNREAAARLIGDAGELVAEGVSTVASELKPLLDALAAGIGASSTPAEADMRIELALKRYESDALVEAIFASNIMAEMAGDLMVREGERGARKFAKGLSLAEPGASDAFLDSPWADAVEEFRKRSGVGSEELRRLLQNTAARSREEQRKLLTHIQETVRDNLAYAIADGETYADFADALRNDLVPLGVTAEDDSYLQMVFRTNVSGAYSAGRDSASKDPELLAERPFALYLTAGDGLVRDEHREYAERNGGIYRIGSAEWEAVRPPPKGSPYNCRCSWVTLTEEQARERGWTG